MERMQKIVDFLKQISLAQSIALAAGVALLWLLRDRVTFPESVDGWKQVVDVALYVLAGLATVGALANGKKAPAATPTPPADARSIASALEPEDEDDTPAGGSAGFVTAELLGWLVVWAGLALLAASHLSGCGGAPHAARATVLAATEAISEVDQVVAPLYVAAASAAYNEATDLADYRARIRLWDGLELSLRVTWQALRAADAALDAWDAGGAERWLPLAGCIALAVGNLVSAIDAVDVDIPPELRQSLALAAAIGAPVCGTGSAPDAAPGGA